MQRALDRRPSIAWRMFTDEERLYCEGTARPAEHYAARFAAREAVLKALGCGFGKGVKVKDVSVAHADNGRPVAVLRGRVRRSPPSAVSQRWPSRSRSRTRWRPRWRCW